MSDTASHPRRHPGDLSVERRLDDMSDDLRTIKTLLTEVKAALAAGTVKHEDIDRRLTLIETKLNDDEKGLAATRIVAVAAREKADKVFNWIIATLVFVVIAVASAILKLVIP